MLPGQCVEALGPLGIARPRVRERLGDAEHVGAGTHARLDLVGDLVQVALRVDADDVGLRGEHRLEVGGHRHVASRPEQLADRHALLGGIGDDRADELDVVGPVEHVAEKPLAHHAGSPHRDLDHVTPLSK